MPPHIIGVDLYAQRISNRRKRAGHFLKESKFIDTFLERLRAIMGERHEGVFGELSIYEPENVESCYIQGTRVFQTSVRSIYEASEF